MTLESKRTSHWVKDEMKVCVRACTYSEFVEASHLPQRASCLRGWALPSPPLSSTESSKCGCHSWSTFSKGELAFLWYTVVLKFLPLNTFDQAVAKTRPMTCKKGICKASIWAGSKIQAAGGLMQCCLTFNSGNFNAATSRLWDMCIEVGEDTWKACVSMLSWCSEDI